MESFCSRLDYLLYNIYPCRIKNYNDMITATTLDRICATDLDSDGIDAIQTYTTQDEFIQIYDTQIEIWRFENEFNPDGLQMELVASFPSPINESIEYAASDFRAMDLNSISSEFRNINGAVVVWEGGTKRNIVVFNNDGEVVTESIQTPMTATEIRTCCVGEINYPVVYPEATDREGLIGHGDMRILMCYETSPSSPLGVRIFKKTPTGLVNVIGSSDGPHSLALPNGFEPTGCVWGAFWKQEDVDPESGFILYNNNGQYAIVSQIGSSPEFWHCSPLFSNLFPDGFELPEDEDLLFISRLNTSPNGGLNPAHRAGRDFLCVVVEGGFFDFLHWKSGGEDGTPSRGLKYGGSVQLTTFPSSTIISAGTDRSGSSWNSYADRLVLSLDNGVVYASEDPLVFEALESPLSTEVILFKPHSDVKFLTAARVFLSKLPHRSAVLWRSNGSVIISNAQLNSGEDYISSFIEAYDDIWDHGNFDYSGKCLIPNVQAYGRHGQRTATYCPSIDTLRYMTVSPIIHGARGVQYYGLDLAMLSGNGIEGGSGAFTCPAELVNWGPSSENENPNMIYRVHQITRELNGLIDGVHSPYAGALIAPQCYAMDETEVVHAEYVSGRLEVCEDDQCNFLALKSSTTGNIYILLANDTDDYALSQKVLLFKNELGDNWELHHTGGFEVTLLSSTCSTDHFSSETLSSIGLSQMDQFESAIIDRPDDRSEIPLIIDYNDMPPYSASLFYLTFHGSGSPIGAEERDLTPSIVVDSQNGILTVECAIERNYSNAAINIFDLSGRLVVNIWSDQTGRYGDFTTSINTNGYPAALYFVGLQVDEHLISEKFIVF